MMRLEIPNELHKEAYEALMERWEETEPQMQPELLRRGKATYEKWLSWCEDDRTTGSMLPPYRKKLSFFQILIL